MIKYSMLKNKFGNVQYRSRMKLDFIKCILFFRISGDIFIYKSILFIFSQHQICYDEVAESN